MNTLTDLFSQFIGQYAWSVQRGYGSFLTLEFGAPHLEVREPIVSKSGGSERVRINMARRRVFVVGDWHVWIKYTTWRIICDDYSIDSNERNDKRDLYCLNMLEGQIFTSFSDENNGHFNLNFDLGGQIILAPDKNSEDDMLSVHKWNGEILTILNSGLVLSEQHASRDRGM